MLKLRRPSPALVIAVLALFVGLGGGAYAAKKIGTKDLKNNAVTSKKIKNNAVNSNKIKNGQIKGSDLGSRIPYDIGPPVGGSGDATSEDKSPFIECPESGQVPVTGGAHIVGGDGFVALTESRQVFPPGYPDIGWVASAIEVNGGTSEDWSLNVTLVCQKAKP